MNTINEETLITKAIEVKGIRAEKIIYNVLCDGAKPSNCRCGNDSCQGMSLTLGAATKLKGKSGELVGLLQILNHLPNISKYKKK